MYDMQQYQAEALATESPITPDMQKMLVRVWEVSAELLFDMGTAGQQMDRVKRTVYYGKVDGELMDELMPTHPTGEKRERIEQCARLFHGICGIFTEIGEACEEMHRFIDEGGQLNVENIKEEMGDLLWYINLVLATLGTNIVEVAKRNIAKLKARYPNKFEALRAIQRDLEAERKALINASDTIANLEEKNNAEKNNHALPYEVVREDLKAFVLMAVIFRDTPIVDNDFESQRNKFDGMLHELLGKYDLAR